MERTSAMVKYERPTNPEQSYVWHSCWECEDVPDPEQHPDYQPELDSPGIEYVDPDEFWSDPCWRTS